MRVKTDQLVSVSKSPSGISSSGTVPPRHFQQNDQLNIIKQENMMDSFSQLKNPVIRYSETYNLPPDKVSNKCKLDDLNVGIKSISLNIESGKKEENAVSARSPNNILSKNIGNNISASPQIKNCDSVILKSSDGRNFLVKRNLICCFDDKRNRKNADENGTSTDAEADDEGGDADDNVAVDSRDEGKAKSDQAGEDEESTASKSKDKKTSLKTNMNNSAVSELDVKFSNLKLKDGTNNTHQSSFVIVRSKDCGNGVIKSLGRLVIVPSDSDSSSDSGGEDEPVKVGSGLIAKGPMRKPLVIPNQRSGVPFSMPQRRVALENRYSSFAQNFLSPASARPAAQAPVDDLELNVKFSDHEAAFIRSTPKNLAVYLEDGILDQDSRSSNEENVSPCPELYSPQVNSANVHKNVFTDIVYPPCIDNICSKPNTEIPTLNIPVTTRSNSATSVFDGYTSGDSDYGSRAESNEGSPFSCYSPDRTAEDDQACSPSVMNIPPNRQTTLCVPNIRPNTVNTGCKQSVPKTPVKFHDSDSFAVVYRGSDGVTETCLNDQQWSSNQASAVSDCNLPVIQTNSTSVYYTFVPAMSECYVYNHSGQQLSSPNFVLTPAANPSNDTTKNIPSRKVRSIVEVGGVKVFEDEMRQSGYERLKRSCKNDLFAIQYISTLVKMGGLGEEKKSLILTDILKELSTFFGDTQPNSNPNEVSKPNQFWREKLHAHIECAFQSFDKEKGIFTRADSEGNTPLKLAAFSNYKEPLIARCIADCIVKQNLRADEIDNSGNTIIHRLCLKGDSHIKVLAELLNVKNNGQPVFNVNARNLNNETPLHYAATSNLCSVTVLQLLRHRDAAVDAQDINNATPLHALLSIVYQEYDTQKLKCLLASPSCQRALFVKDCNGNTPLMIAALNNNVSKTNQLKAIQKLVDSNAISTKQRAYEKMKKGILSLVEVDRVEDVRAVLEGTIRYN